MRGNSPVYGVTRARCNSENIHFLTIYLGKEMPRKYIPPHKLPSPNFEILNSYFIPKYTVLNINMCENLHYFTIQSLNLSQINEEVGHETKNRFCILLNPSRKWMCILTNFRSIIHLTFLTLIV